ncbi:MAG: efflux RND transporter periplasmic adaptor subunit [Syntrophales bacterium]|jgi:RND family efflux transporter MFP subunit|nr:efflux RND transporter periplasmic adaptor subunit [Syntrophales bacterium]MCK9391763.1 efflux RND transporter periplasmic adaptor subunit [Syntrophales bacterium]
MPAEDIAKLKIEKSEKIVKPSRYKKKPLVIAAIILLLLVTGGLYFGGIIAPAISVDVTTISQVYPSQSISILNASGYIVAQRKAAVASKVTGRLVALMVEEGSKVKQGEVIARMENVDVTAFRNQAAANLNTVRATLEQAKAERDIALLEYTRYKKLFESNFVAKSDYDVTVTRYKRAVEGVKGAEATVRAGIAALQNAEAGLDYTLVRAPFDAVVLTKNADVGDIVTPMGSAANAKAAVVTIADMKSLQVEADVSETSIASIRVGQPCDIQLDALPNMRFQGEVYTIVPTVDRSKATVLVKVRFLDKDPRMLPDMSAKVSFLSRRLEPEELKPRLAVSQSALISRGNKTFVFLLQGNRVKETLVQVGSKLGDMTEVISGLKPGDRAVIKPSKGLKNGSRIKVAER